MPKDTDIRANANLIQLAYELVIEPYKLIELDRIFDDRLKEIGANGQALMDRNADDLSELLPFFESALALAEKKGAADLTIQSPPMTHKRNASLKISEDGKVLDIADDARPLLGLQAGDRLQARLMQPKRGRKRDISSPRHGAPRTDILEIEEIESGKTGRYVLEWDVNDPDGVIGYLRRLDMVWDEYSGRALAERLSLTGAEHAICKAVVTGQSLRAFADVRGRSIGTVRNQLKRMLAKLDLNSQTELVCLYAGFSKLSRLRPDNIGRPFRYDPERSFEILKTRKGEHLAFDTLGAASARPVIYLHPVIGGNFISDEIKAAMKGADLRLIMPWRPFFGDTTVSGEGDDLIAAFADALVDLLDHLEIARCPVIAANGAAPYGFGFSKRHPDRCNGLILGAGTLPVFGNESLKHMTPPQRVPYYLSTHAPAILRFYIRSLVGKIEAGYERLYARNFFQGSPSDISFAEEMDFLESAKEALSYSFVSGTHAVMNEFALNARDWSHLAHGSECPARFIYGEEEVQHPEHRVRDFAETLENASVEMVPKAGSMVFFQRPDVFVDAINAFYGNDAS